MSSFKFELQAQGRKADLQLKISDAPGGEEVWRCYPDHFLGAGKGRPAWKGREIGLFSESGAAHGAFHYGVLVAPEDGMDTAPIGATGEARFSNWGVGTWRLKNKFAS